MLIFNVLDCFPRFLRTALKPLLAMTNLQTEPAPFSRVVIGNKKARLRGLQGLFKPYSLRNCLFVCCFQVQFELHAEDNRLIV
jgi:inosine/xanthosine triphosphate pyrophosphatase family protein